MGSYEKAVVAQYLVSCEVEKADEMIETLGLECIAGDTIRCNIETFQLNKNGRNWKISTILGRGNFATTYLAKHPEKVVALKKINCHDAITRESALAEASLMMKLQSKFIVRIQETFMTGTAVYIAMDYCDEGTVEDLIRDRKVNKIGGLSILKHITC